MHNAIYPVKMRLCWSIFRSYYVCRVEPDSTCHAVHGSRVDWSRQTDGLGFQVPEAADWVLSAITGAVPASSVCEFKCWCWRWWRCWYNRSWTVLVAEPGDVYCRLRVQLWWQRCTRRRRNIRQRAVFNYHPAVLRCRVSTGVTGVAVPSNHQDRPTEGGARSSAGAHLRGCFA